MKTLKKYTTPKMEIIDAELQTSLLAGSCESNPYWQCGDGDYWHGSWGDNDND
jgi:hypothetical protein